MSAGNSRPAGATTRSRETLPVSGDLVIAVMILAAFPMAGLWIGHGGLQQLTTPAGMATAVGQLTALAGTYLALVQLVLMARSPWLDRAFGMDRLAVWHRWLGFATVWMLVAHGLLTTVGFAATSNTSIVAEAWAMVTTYPFVLMAVASLGLFILVAVSSVRWARRKLTYETWYGLHVYAYLAIALGFAHQLVVGTDFMNEVLARAYWVLLYAATVALVLVFRVGQPIATSLHHGLRVANVVPEGPGVVSIYLTGIDLERLSVDAGQYFQWRFLTRATWWRTHPFSLSAAPNGRWLRITVKALGDDTRALASLPVGTRVFIEGPYGALTLARRSRRGVLLIAGGIGIAPLRALYEALPPSGGDVALIYRASGADDLVLRAELDEIARVRGHRVHYLVGRRGVPMLPADPLGPEAISRLVPDAAERDAYLCGPVAMMRRVEDALARLGVPSAQIHAERFAY
jgi:predicted ferric reductase